METSTKEIQLIFCARKLENVDGIFDKSDPQATLYEQLPETRWAEVGKTELIQNDLNPNFSLPVILNYTPEKNQVVRVDINDLDDGKPTLIGGLTTELKVILEADQKEGFTAKLMNKKNKPTGLINIKYSIIEKFIPDYVFNVKAAKIENTEWFSKSDPFLTFSRPMKHYAKENANKIPKNGWILVHRTNHFADNLNPDFEPFEFSSARFCYSDLDCLIKLQIWDYSKKGNHELISTGDFTLRQIVSGKIKQIKTFNASGNAAGTIIVESLTKIQASLGSIVETGIELDFVFGVDFSGSNGRRDDAHHRHRIVEADGEAGDGEKTVEMNVYQKLLKVFEDLLKSSHTGGRLEAYAFGCRSPSKGFFSPYELIPLGENQGVIDGYGAFLGSYNNSAGHLEPAGPTTFTGVLQKAIENAYKSRERGATKKYNLVVYITDGCPVDEDEFIDALIEASTLPISVIFVGVGEANFGDLIAIAEAVEILEGSTGAKLARNMSKFCHYPEGGEEPGKALADVIERCFPTQVREYFNKLVQSDEHKKE